MLLFVVGRVMSTHHDQTENLKQAKEELAIVRSANEVEFLALQEPKTEGNVWERVAMQIDFSSKVCL